MGFMNKAKDFFSPDYIIRNEKDVGRLIGLAKRGGGDEGVAAMQGMVNKAKEEVKGMEGKVPSIKIGRSSKIVTNFMDSDGSGNLSKVRVGATAAIAAAGVSAFGYGAYRCYNRE